MDVEVAEVGIREFKAHMGRYLSRVKDGEELVLTDRGTAVCRVVPNPDTLQRRFHKLMEARAIEWNGKRPEFPADLVPSSGKRSVSDIVLEDRD